jgi:hypothetical protein
MSAGLIVVALFFAVGASDGDDEVDDDVDVVVAEGVFDGDDLVAVDVDGDGDCDVVDALSVAA